MSDELLIKYAREIKNGVVVSQYYNCRDCNTKRAKRYRMTQKGRENINKNARKSYLKHKERHSARAKLNNALNLGKIIKPRCCLYCTESKIEAHHEDYSKPFEVVWLCRKHHADLHRKSL